MKHPLFIFLMLLTTVKLNGQLPQGFAFQTIIRDSEGKVLKNQTVGLQFSILEGGETGTSAYTERHTAISNAYGVINVTIGQGTLVSGTYDEINWGGTLHYLKTDIDLDGGVNYSISKTAQLVSVPYSEYAKKASVADTVLKVPDDSPTNEIQIINATSNKISLSGGGGEISLNTGFQFFTSISTEESNTTYVGCLIFCRNLEENQENNWKMATLKEIEYFILNDNSIPIGGFETWTKDFLTSTPFYDQAAKDLYLWTPYFILDGNGEGRIEFNDIKTGAFVDQLYGGIVTQKCRCFR